MWEMTNLNSQNILKVLKGVIAALVLVCPYICTHQVCRALTPKLATQKVGLAGLICSKIACVFEISK